MRDLLFKNLTSTDHKKRIIASSEIVDNQGMRSVIHRHFICMVKEINGTEVSKPAPCLYVLKEHNSKEQKEKFFCKIKGSVYIVNKDKNYLVIFMHTLKIDLLANLVSSNLT